MKRKSFGPNPVSWRRPVYDLSKTTKEASFSSCFRCGSKPNASVRRALYSSRVLNLILVMVCFYLLFCLYYTHNSPCAILRLDIKLFCFHFFTWPQNSEISQELFIPIWMFFCSNGLTADLVKRTYFTHISYLIRPRRTARNMPSE